MKIGPIEITISGGAVQHVENPSSIDIIIRDYDVEGTDCASWPGCKQDEHGDWYQEISFPAAH